MKKQMERTVYEAPVTERFSVELEGAFCASIYEEEKHQKGVSSAVQEYETFEDGSGFVQENGSIKWE